jgi:hypothetical protein
MGLGLSFLSLVVLRSSFFLLAIPAGAILYFACLFLLTGKKLINELWSIKQLLSRQNLK